MNVIVTGAAGFVASHLVDRYLAGGHHVLGFDNFSTGASENLIAARTSDRFTFVEADVTNAWDEPLARAGARFAKPDLVLHMASPASPVDYAALPLETLAVNSIGTRLAAECAKAAGARFLFASTSETYGDPLQHPQVESYWGNVNPVGPRSCYDEAKRFGEALVSTMTRSFGLDGRIIRIFNTYGPRMRKNDGRVVPNFVMQALRGEPLTIYGDGSQTRSFCYVSDLVDGIVRCAASDVTRGRVVNLGNPVEHTIREFAEIVCEVASVRLDVVERPIPVDDPTRRCPDISVAKELLGWSPVVDLPTGLATTIASFRGTATAVV